MWSSTLGIAPSRPSKNPARHVRSQSPTLQRYGEIPTSTSVGSLASNSSGWKGGSAPNAKPIFVEKIQPLSFVLQAPEEQTDNWDDDFEEGISFTKLQGMPFLFVPCV
jgi:hypothetical protein